MRKTTFIPALGLALVLGAAVAASAQPPAGGRPDAAADSTHRGRRGPGDRQGQRGARGPEGFLLRGITLTDAQKQQVATLREQQRDRMRAQREQFGANRGANRSANRGANGNANGAQRQRPDSATMAKLRQQFQAERSRNEAALRAILTPEQRKQFDANRAEMEKRAGERRAEGRGPRADWRARQG